MNELYVPLIEAAKWSIIVVTMGLTLCGVGFFFLWLIFAFDVDEYNAKKKKKKSKLHSIKNG